MIYQTVPRDLKQTDVAILFQQCYSMLISYIENHELFGTLTKNCPKLDKNKSMVPRFSVFVVYKSAVSTVQATM